MSRGRRRPGLGRAGLFYEASGPEERKLLAQALFERIDVLGVEEVTLKVTQQAMDNGWLEAWAGQTLSVPLEGCTCGRGERSRGFTIPIWGWVTPPPGFHLVREDSA